MNGIDNGILVTFQKHRDDQTFGKALNPFEIRWDKSPQGLLRWAAIDAETSETGTWAPLPETQNAHACCVDESFIEATFKGREADIVRCLAKAALKGKQWLKRLEIDHQLGVSGSTTRSTFDNLAANQHIVVEGKGKATRYSLSPKMAKSIVHE